MNTNVIVCAIESKLDTNRDILICKMQPIEPNLDMNQDILLCCVYRIQSNIRITPDIMISVVHSIEHSIGVYRNIVNVWRVLYCIDLLIRSKMLSLLMQLSISCVSRSIRTQWMEQKPQIHSSNQSNRLCLSRFLPKMAMSEYRYQFGIFALKPPCLC